ncbi:unnamed protein product [Symbiodinium natans]|uniref:Uncharacterized protein n=1 Tax=Symbiodinium natans TaxID=878477 RepID=A0A812GVI8_9DINO|nr:unnamed protein product [Symbiodinium natans]
MPMRLCISRASMSSKTNPLEDDMPMQLQVMSGASGGSGSEAPQVPEERSQWELASLDPSSWPIFGITSEGFAGIGVSKDGLIRDSEKSLHFALDQAVLASITEGDASFNSVQFAPSNVAGSLQEALSQAREQNRSLRDLCWDIVALAADLEGKESAFEAEDHEQLLFEARRSLHIIHSQLEKALEIPEAPKEPSLITPSVGAKPEDPVAKEAPEVDVEAEVGDSCAPEVLFAGKPQDTVDVQKLADTGIEGTPEITYQPGTYATQPEVTAGPTLLAAREAQRQTCQFMNPVPEPRFMSPVQRRVSQPLLFSPSLQTTRSLLLPPASALARSVTCPVRHTPMHMNTTRGHSPLHIHTTRGHSIVAPRFISKGNDPRPCCEPITRAASPPPPLATRAASPPLMPRCSPPSDLRELRDVSMNPNAPAWKWQTSASPTSASPTSPACWPRPAAQGCRPCWVLTRSTS